MARRAPLTDADWRAANEKIVLPPLPDASSSNRGVESALPALLRQVRRVTASRRRQRRARRSFPATSYRLIARLLKTDAEFAARPITLRDAGFSPDSLSALTVHQFEALGEEQGHQWRRRVSSAPHHGALWGFLARAEHQAGGPARRPAYAPLCSEPILLGPGSASHASQARLLGKHFATRGVRRAERPGAVTTQFLAAPAPPVCPVSLLEVRRAVERLCKSSAPGRGAITTLAWSRLPRTHAWLAALLSHVPETGFAPQPLLRADVVPTPKPGRSGFAAYRPIFLLPLVAKILKRVVLDRVLASVGERLPAEQYVFPPQLSCDVLLADLGREICSAQRADQHSLLVSLDIGWACDSVRPRRLLRKAVDFGLPAWAVRWLRSWTH